MSSRPQAGPFQVINNGSMGADIVSDITIVKLLSLISYSFSWTGSTPVGVLSIEVSNDYSENKDGSVRNVGTWNTLTLNYGGEAVSSIPVSGNAGNGFIDLDLTGAYAMRARYTRASGTGTMQSILNAKVS